jgi:hypothetical protein
MLPACCSISRMPCWRVQRGRCRATGGRVGGGSGAGRWVALWGQMLDRLNVVAEAGTAGAAADRPGRLHRRGVLPSAGQTVLASGDFLSDRALLADPVTTALRGGNALPSVFKWVRLFWSDLIVPVRNCPATICGGGRGMAGVLQPATTCSNSSRDRPNTPAASLLLLRIPLAPLLSHVLVPTPTNVAGRSPSNNQVRHKTPGHTRRRPHSRGAAPFSNLRLCGGFWPGQIWVG